MALAPFSATAHLLTQWSDNEPVSATEVTKAVIESQKARKNDDNDPVFTNTRHYAHSLHQHLTKAQKREQTEDKLAWHLASHSNRILAKNKPDDDLLEQFKSKKDLLQRHSSSASSEPLKTLSTLITKADAIKNDSNKLSPIAQLNSDIWQLILFNSDHGKKGVANYSGVSTQFDPCIRDIVIKEINANKLQLPELGFYSIEQITKFFGEKIKDLKHISFVFHGGVDSPTGRTRLEYLCNQPLPSQSKQEPVPTEQEQFCAFIRSLKGIDSFQFDRSLVSACKDSLLPKKKVPVLRFKDPDAREVNFRSNLPDDKDIKLTGDLFIDFCKNNKNIKHLAIGSLDLETYKNTDSINITCAAKILEGLEYLNNLESFTVYEGAAIGTSAKINLESKKLHKLKILYYPYLWRCDFNALQKYTELESAYFSHTHDSCKNNLIKEITQNLTNSKIKHLKIRERNKSAHSYLEFIYLEFISTHFEDPHPLPSSLENLTLEGACINLKNLLISVFESPSLHRLELQNCNLIWDSNDDLSELCKQYSNIKKTVYFNECHLLRRVNFSYTFKDETIANIIARLTAFESESGELSDGGQNSKFKPDPD